MLNAAPPWPSADASGTLTERQLEVLRLVGNGEPNKSVARLLGLEEQTVKGHLTAIFKALGTVNRVQAIQAARAAGMLP
jgi:DNA-binding NarL/FixJ family response regulator